MSFAKEDRHQDMSDLFLMLEPEPFGALVVDGITEAVHPTLDAGGPGTVTFKWSR